MKIRWKNQLPNITDGRVTVMVPMALADQLQLEPGQDYSVVADVIKGKTILKVTVSHNGNGA